MQKLKIRGGKPLFGTVLVSGAKNAAVGILPAALMATGGCVIENLPDIEDVRLFADIFRKMGADVEFDGAAMNISGEGMSNPTADFDLVGRMRASYYLLGSMLGRFGRAEVALPGGCFIGVRPIDLHIKGMEALGATTKVERGVLKAEAKNGLRGADIYLDTVSVGATINIMLAAVWAEGQTVIANAAKEPHVVDVANFLNCIGASVKGAGTDVIRINGGRPLKGCSYAIIPDQIEAGTYMIAAAAAGGDVTVRNVIPTHLEAVTAKLMEMGYSVTEGDDGREFFIQVKSDGQRPRGVNVRTLPYPGFPTDLQQPIMALLTRNKDASQVYETIFEDRFKHVPYLCRMGAEISVSGRVATVRGVEGLSGCPVTATDLRAGASLIVAGLMADGVTTIGNVDYIDRGYEDVEDKLRGLGAEVERVDV
ncbi:MAG: UDP-N-acetylglucosamine 1-carboxyvinyltransferase [Christensenellales bacterium]